MGGDCVRIYMAVEKDGAWEDRAILEMPIKTVIEGSKFATEAVLEIARELTLAEPPKEKVVLAH